MVKTEKDLLPAGYMYPIKIGKNELVLENGFMEVTHAPTGCMLIKRTVIEKLIEKHPELKIYQPTVINGKEVENPLGECMNNGTCTISGYGM